MCQSDKVEFVIRTEIVSTTKLHQTVQVVHDDETRNLITMVLNLENEGVRLALRKLGWREPPVSMENDAGKASN